MTAKRDQPEGGADRARLFNALADPSRLALLERLRKGPAAVGMLASAAGLGQSNTSNHLAVLAGCSLVRRERRGRKVIYSLAGPEVEGMLQLAEMMARRGVPNEGPEGNPVALPGGE